jgi:hypothetical protein
MLALAGPAQVTADRAAASGLIELAIFVNGVVQILQQSGQYGIIEPFA